MTIEQEIARLKERKPELAKPIEPEASATASLPKVVGEILSRVKPMSAEEQRRVQFKYDIVPRMKSLGFEERFRIDVRDFKNKDQAKVFKQCSDLLRGNGAIVALVGIRGTGKTTIAAQLAATRIRDWLDFHAEAPEDRFDDTVKGMPRYRKATSLISEFKSLYADYGSIGSEELTERREHQCREWPILVIDELHECEEQKMKDRVLTDIIDRRYAALTDTLLVSNQSPEDFKATTNPSILSRLGEHGCIIPCNWQSWRAIKK